MPAPAATCAEAMWRCAAFEDLGCEIVYFEGPQSAEEMQAFNGQIKHAYTMLAQVGGPGVRDRPTPGLGGSTQCGMQAHTWRRLDVACAAGSKALNPQPDNEDAGWTHVSLRSVQP
eukprot:353376-Chlamydomonas_euryale.AAC.4